MSRAADPGEYAANADMSRHGRQSQVSRRRELSYAITRSRTAAIQSRKGQNHPEPGTVVMGKISTETRVPSRRRHKPDRN